MAAAAGLLLSVGVVVVSLHGASKKFYDDDPLMREPATQDASGAEPRDIDLFWDLTSNLFGRLGDPAPDVPARNVNTIDEVPDSGWFTNRILTRPLSIAEVAQGPQAGPEPASDQWTVIRPKTVGAAQASPRAMHAESSGSSPSTRRATPEAATGAVIAANKIFWALGYWQVENYLTLIRPEDVAIAEGVRFTPPSGVTRPMKNGDLEAVFGRAHRRADGAYRAVAARGLPGKILGGFDYYGTRPDDPNDVVPHEHRRELRALKVFGAWTNLVDMKAANTLDTVLQEDGRGIVRHYLQDVGSTFGAGAIGPHSWDEGWEYLYEGRTLWRRLITFGLHQQPWQEVEYRNVPSIGRFEGEAFNPRTWKPRAPTAAFLRARPDDDFWAARRVVAFSDEMIRAVARSGEYQRPCGRATPRGTS